MVSSKDKSNKLRLLPADRRPLRPPTNLPLQPTSFIGREQELAELEKCLLVSRLLTLTGAGGLGKTRLGLAVAERVRDRHSDGVWLIDMAPVADAALVPLAVARALEVREQEAQSLTETLVAILAPMDLMLVLDNCEHVVDGCAALVEALLRACPSVTILATSREPLNAAGEQSRLVPPLTRPLAGQTLTVEQAPEFESMRLLVERARAVLPSFAITNENLEAVTQICEQLEGIPLALELAAVRLRALTVQELSARLQDRFRLLTSGGRAAPLRHQTLRALVDWSYDLLSRPEQALFRRLSVFAGGCTLAAAESVCGTPGENYDIFGLVAQLVEKSLVLVDRESSEARYRMFETLRQYGAEKLRGAGEEADVRSRHLGWAIALAREAEVGFRGRRQAAWFQRMETELENVRVALHWGTSNASLSDGLELAGTLWQFWWLRGHTPEGQRWLSALLTQASLRPEAERDTSPLRAARARALTAVGFLAHKQQHTAMACSALAEALPIWRGLGDERLLGLTLRELAHTALEEHDFDAAAPVIDEGLRLAEETGSLQLRHDMLFPLALLARRSGDRDRAQTLFEECVVLGREEGDLRRVALPLLHLGAVLLERGHLADARAALLESMDTHHAAGIRAGLAPALELLACLEAIEDRPARALRLSGAATAIAASLGATEAAFVHAQAQAKSQLEAARRGLPPETAAVASAEGEAMALQDALAYARTAVGDMTIAAANPPASLLTDREQEVAALVALGMTNRQIGASLFISEWTVKRHVENILRRLSAESRAQIAAWVSERDALAATLALLPSPLPSSSAASLPTR